MTITVAVPRGNSLLFNAYNELCCNKKIELVGVGFNFYAMIEDLNQFSEEMKQSLTNAKADDFDKFISNQIFEKSLEDAVIER